MNDDYYRCSHKNSSEDTKVPKATTERASWLRKYNPRSYPNCHMLIYGSSASGMTLFPQALFNTESTQIQLRSIWTR